MQQKHDDVMMMHELKFTNKEINKGITFGMLHELTHDLCAWYLYVGLGISP